ncbi:hypothetical protein PFLUV_G00037980 [Perca fluviatilis]|uniref:Uncharacterized protein n=1 Tax=Perca fluviatilis TaxID=8168 RepID=A0A6A5FR13_PERFL|nr:hypothetical protein PFLUV_G00037980 [Perca fluviatilis]
MLMLGLASGRYGGQLSCPDVKYQGLTFSRLDCHLVNLHNMAKAVRTAVLLSQRKTQVAGSPPTAGCPSPAGCPPPEGCSSRLAEDEDDALELLFSSGRSEWDDDSVPDFSWLF